MDIDYIDRCSVAELSEHYPELNDLPLVEPNIIGDAETMEGIPSDAYDFLISAHVIEHMKNPLSSLEQWCRVVKPGGVIISSCLTSEVLLILSECAQRLLIWCSIISVHLMSEITSIILTTLSTFTTKAVREAVVEADRLVETDYSIHFHVFLPTDVLNLLRWFSANIHPVEVLEGPVMSPGSDEFHFMLKVS